MKPKDQLLILNNELNNLKRKFADLTPVQKDAVLTLKNKTEVFVKNNGAFAVVAINFVLLNEAIQKLGDVVRAQQKLDDIIKKQQKEKETKNNSSMH